MFVLTHRDVVQDTVKLRCGFETALKKTPGHDVISTCLVVYDVVMTCDDLVCVSVESVSCFGSRLVSENLSTSEAW